MSRRDTKRREARRPDDEGRPLPHHQKKTPENLSRFLEVLRKTANVSEACRAIGISRWLAYNAWKVDKALTVSLDVGDDGEPVVMSFSDAWDQALEEASDDLEYSARDWAIRGVEEPVIHQGQLMYLRDADGEVELDVCGDPVPLTVRKRSEGLTKFLLEGRRPEVFRRGSDLRVDATVRHGVLMIPDTTEKTDEQLEAEMAAGQAKFRGA